ncbi:STAS domain-containing protein [Saccharothrix australiensis]|uniref:Anti-sigma factor antagonist n=1 Tax=Saccharothrix australiensis TaxID=2072 RepID=A0A495VZS8_9PSEU|nr:STAS domain-containing protein [Saccharothrix australiensis]RKT54390.1 anti-anti-sigma factor [Saccharothrix australiensis]
MDDRLNRGGPVRIETTVVGDAVVVCVAGDVDMAPACSPRNEVLGRLDARPSALVVDLSEVTFFGSPGISALVAASQKAERLGVRFAVVADQRAVLRPLQVTGVASTLDVYASRADALDARPGVPAPGSGS